MKIDVPFHKSIKDTDCGPMVLKMALEYLGEKHSFEELSKLERQLDTGMVWSVGIVRATKKLGFNVKFISTTNFSYEEDIDYYNKYANSKSMLVLKELQEEIKELGINVEEKDLQLSELLAYVSKDSVPIVLLNWYVIAGKEGYNGHFVPVVGYDQENVYIHNSGLANAQAYLPIKKELFLKAWESKGTDKDTIIISKKEI